MVWQVVARIRHLSLAECGDKLVCGRGAGGGRAAVVVAVNRYIGCFVRDTDEVLFESMVGYSVRFRVAMVEIGVRVGGQGESGGGGGEVTR